MDCGDATLSKRKREPGDEGDQDDPAMDSIMTLMCDDAQWEILNFQKFNSQDLDEEQACEDDSEVWEDQGEPIYDDLTGRKLLLEKVRDDRLD